jgi:peptide/nickel transport system permease protein
MFRFIVRRLVQLIPVLFFVSVIVFGMVRLAPGDPALIMTGGRQTSPAVLDSIRQKYHLEEPVYKQYLYWAGDALRGNLGESFRLKQSVTGLILDRLPLTLQLVLMSTLFSLLFAIPLGVLSAVRKNTWTDYLISIVTLAGVSSPVFLTGILGVLVFSYTLNILPAFGIGSGFFDNFRYLLLPSLALGFNMIALSSRITRSSMIGVLETGYIRTAVAKGLPKGTVVFKHGLKNALVPVITVAGLQTGFLMVGSVLVEYTFGIGGLGSLIVNSVQQSDYPVVQGTVLFMVTVFLAINLLVDILYAAIDPRIRYG